MRPKMGCNQCMSGSVVVLFASAFILDSNIGLPLWTLLIVQGEACKDCPVSCHREIPFVTATIMQKLNSSAIEMDNTSVRLT